MAAPFTWRHLTPNLPASLASVTCPAPLHLRLAPATKGQLALTGSKCFLVGLGEMVLCISLRSLPIWLFKIEPNVCEPEQGGWILLSAVGNHCHALTGGDGSDSGFRIRRLDCRRARVDAGRAWGDACRSLGKRQQKPHGQREEERVA